MTAQTAWAETVQTYYIDENGTRHDETTTATNSYYTAALGSALATAPLTVLASDNVTVEAVSGEDLIMPEDYTLEDDDDDV